MTDAVWTGSSVIVTGRVSSEGNRSTAAATYDVERDEWTMLPSPPVDSAVQLGPVVWSGREVLALGSGNVQSDQPGPLPVVAFDVARGTWRSRRPGWSSAASHPRPGAGEELVVWGGEAHTGFSSEPIRRRRPLRAGREPLTVQSIQ